MADGADGRLTTHVLDTASGRPAAGLKIALYRLEGRRAAHLKTVATNADGRCDAPLLEGEDFAHRPSTNWSSSAGDYLRAQGAELPDPAFPRQVPIRFGMAERGALPRAAAAFALRLFDLQGELMTDIRSEIRFLLNGEAVTLSRCEARRDAARLPAAAPLAARHQGRLRGGRLRRLHGAGRPAGRRWARL